MKARILLSILTGRFEYLLHIAICRHCHYFSDGATSRLEIRRLDIIMTFCISPEEEGEKREREPVKLLRTYRIL